MKAIILGAGIIGVTSAYFLRKEGYDVTVIDRQSDVALETSFANGGQVSVCYSEPWSNISNIKKIFKWIGREDSPILLRPHFDLNQFKWGMNFLYQSLPFNNHKNIKEMLKISLYSRNILKYLRKELHLEYQQITKGILTYYTNEHSFEAAKKDSEFMLRYGCNRVIKNKEDTFLIEPTLKNSTFNIVGSDYTDDDESGNAKIFTEQMKKECEKIGVNFIFNTEIIDVAKKRNSISHLLTLDSNSVKFDLKNTSKRIYDLTNTKIIQGDLFVCCLGSYTPLFTKKLKIYLPIYPAKGYSATFNITNPELINEISLTDSDKKIVFTRLNNQLRVAGTAEFNGYNLELNFSRCDALLKRTKELFPKGLDYSLVKYWTGLRPSTPGNTPIISKTKVDNFYINSGHGTLGWTMACGSGKLISEIITNKKLFSFEGI